jgi:hypothetical protein
LRGFKLDPVYAVSGFHSRRQRLPQVCSALLTHLTRISLPEHEHNLLYIPSPVQQSCFSSTQPSFLLTLSQFILLKALLTAIQHPSYLIRLRVHRITCNLFSATYSPRLSTLEVVLRLLCVPCISRQCVLAGRMTTGMQSHSQHLLTVTNPTRRTPAGRP